MISIRSSISIQQSYLYHQQEGPHYNLRSIGGHSLLRAWGRESGHTRHGNRAEQLFNIGVLHLPRI